MHSYNKLVGHDWHLEAGPPEWIVVTDLC